MRKHEERLITLLVIAGAIQGLAALLRLIVLIAEHVHVTVTP